MCWHMTLFNTVSSALHSASFAMGLSQVQGRGVWGVIVSGADRGRKGKKGEMEPTVHQQNKKRQQQGNHVNKRWLRKQQKFFFFLFW